MTRRTFAFAVGAAVAWPRLARAQAFDPTADPLIQKALAVNRGLKSYRARLRVQSRVAVGSFTLQGTVYSRGGDTKVVFEHVPTIAKASVENQPSLGDPTTWPASYVITVVRSEPGTTTYHLVPRVAGSVRSVDVVLADDSGLARRYVWSRTNGMTIASDQTYENIEGYQVVQSVTTVTTDGGIKVRSLTTFSGYEFNVDIPDSVFAK